MRMNGSVKDLLSHMELLGLASITSVFSDYASRVILGWKSPDTMVLNAAARELTVDEVSACVRVYLDDLLDEQELISQMIDVGGKEHSPLSPRVAKGLNSKEWASYQSTRDEILDRAGVENPLFVSLVTALGFPAYWSKCLRSQKGRESLDMGASLWEMAPRNSGSEFMKNKYLEHLRFCERFTVEDIAAHIRGEKVEDNGKDRNSSGLHAPAFHLDVLMSFIALTGISLFPVRPVTSGSVGSVSAGTMTTRVDRRRYNCFVLPVTKQPVTLGRYTSICRNPSMYEVANSAVRGQNDFGWHAAIGAPASWLGSHAVSHIVTFHRFAGGTPSCPEYYAQEGTVIPIERM